MRIFRGSVRRIQVFHRKYDRFIFPVSLLVGFVIDNITFNSINLVTSGILLLFYLTMIGVCIYLFHFADLGGKRSSLIQLSLPWIPVLVQYLFGGVFSAFLVFFLRSAPLGASLIFILILVGVLIGSEVFREKFLRLDTQMGLYFAAIFVYLFFALSVIIGEVGTVPFILSSVASALLIFLFLFFLLPRTGIRFHRLKRSLYTTVVGIFVVINVLYLLNLVPPVPLVLKDLGVYHSVEHLPGGHYIVEREEDVGGGFLFGIFNDYDHDVKNVPGTRVYVYSSVYAPGGVEAKIVHVWKHFDEETGRWVTTDRIPFSVIGGRGKGYRGYTYKTSLQEGGWRVEVVTDYGALIGSVTFTIESVAKPVPTVHEVI